MFSRVTQRAAEHIVPAAVAVLTVAAISWPWQLSVEALGTAGSRIAGVGRTTLPGDLRDLLINALIFVPLGWSVARASRSLAWAAGVAAALSAGIEISQLAQPARIVSPADLAANTLGALVAAAATLRLPTLIRRVRRSAPNPLMLALVGAIVAALVYSGLERTYGRLNTWDPDYSLLLNNEATGDRPWCGEVLAMELAAGERIWTLDDLDLTAGGELEGCKSPHWRKSRQPPTALVDVVRSHNTLRIDLTFRPLHHGQTGPARIVSISQDPSARNLTIGQDGADLVVRLRRNGSGANGMRPSYRVAGALLDSSPKYLVLAATAERTVLRMGDRTVDHRIWLARDWWPQLRSRWEWHASPVHAWASFPFWAVMMALPGLLVGAVSRVRQLSVARTGIIAALGGSSASLILWALASPVPIETFLCVPTASAMWAVVGHLHADRQARTGNPTTSE